MKATRASAPVRLDLSGGTLDIWPVHHAVEDPGVTVNVALGLPASAELRPLAKGRVRIVSRDLGREVLYDDAASLRSAVKARTCPLLLLSTALVTMDATSGIELVTHAESPPSAGLGGSSALLIAVLGAIEGARGEMDPDRERLRATAQVIETRLLQKLTGYQDFYPPLYGGLLSVEAGLTGPIVESLPTDFAALGRRLRLAYTGEPHVSTEANWAVLRAFLEREPHAVASIEAIARISRAQREALRSADLDTALACLVEDGALRRRMAPGVTTDRIEGLDAAVRNAGALGTKICGAGGGGCVMVALGDGDPAAVDECLGELECTVLPLALVPDGLRIAKAPEA